MSGALDLRIRYRADAGGWVVVMPCPDPAGCDCPGEDVYGPFPGKRAAREWRDRMVAAWPSSPQAALLRDLEGGGGGS